MSLANSQMSGTSSIRVLLADDHILVAQGLKMLLLETFASVCLVGTGEALLESVRRDPPDIVISDISMPGISGIDALRELQREGCTVPLLFLTVHDEPSLCTAAIRAGARGYVLKNSAGDQLVQAIEVVMAGGSYVTSSVGALAMELSRNSRYMLSEKKLRIVEYVSRGMRSKQIAHRLSLSVRTVESHKYAIMQELGVHTTIELVRKAEKEGLISV